MQGIRINEFLDKKEISSIGILERNIGFKVYEQPKFWEDAVCRMVDGKCLGHKSLHDIEVNIWGRICRIEVKFSTSSATPSQRIRKDKGRLDKWEVPFMQILPEIARTCHSI